VGDSAGLINPLSGDGIQYALLSARWASETIIKCVNQNDYSKKALESYQIKIKDELAYDFALSNMLIQFARNRALTPLWIEIISVLIKRAKNDKAYADIIAGIFEGSYPSYKALTIEFILKSLLQGGVHIGELAANTIAKGPKEWSKSGTELSKIALNLIDSIKQNPKGNLQWLGVLIKNGISVGSYLVKNKAN
jgi:hypothetical protein